MVRGPLTADLIGDMDVASSRVFRCRNLHRLNPIENGTADPGESVGPSQLGRPALLGTALKSAVGIVPTLMTEGVY